MLGRADAPLELAVLVLSSPFGANFWLRCDLFAHRLGRDSTLTFGNSLPRGT